MDQYLRTALSMSRRGVDFPTVQTVDGKSISVIIIEALVSSWTKPENLSVVVKPPGLMSLIRVPGIRTYAPALSLLGEASALPLAEADGSGVSVGPAGPVTRSVLRPSRATVESWSLVAQANIDMQISGSHPCRRTLMNLSSHARPRLNLRLK